MAIPVVAIVGRANVGKSTLFNKIVRQRSAIVHDTPGVTRDRNYGRACWFDKEFILIDTGGVDVGDDPVELQIREQSLLAREEADAVVVLADNQQGLTPSDLEVVEDIRKTGKPWFFAINKVDAPGHFDQLGDFAKVGATNLYAVSAEHGLGISGLLQDVVGVFPDSPPEEEYDGKAVRVAVVGRPNAGKSSLINKLLNSPRCIVSDVPGTTRDTTDSILEVEGKKYIFVDTAGIRKKGKTKKLLDKFSVVMALKAMERSDMVVLVLDAEEGVTSQDAAIAGYALERGRACVIVVNKWDLVEKGEKSFAVYEEEARNNLKFLDFAPIINLSAKTGKRLHKLFPKIDETFAEYCKEITTGKLNSCLEKALLKNPMSQYRGNFLKLYYSTQVRTRPPTFRCFVNYPQGVHFSYRRYLTNYLRKEFGFSGTPVKLVFSPNKAP